MDTFHEQAADQDSSSKTNLPTAARSVSSFGDIAPALEVGAWFAVALAPILRLINGAPVTTDQAVLQAIVAVLSIISAVLLRIYNWTKPPRNPEQVSRK